MVGERLLHVHPNLSDDRLGHSAVHAGDGAQKSHLLRERGERLLYLLTQLRDRFVEVVDVRARILEAIIAWCVPRNDLRELL